MSETPTTEQADYRWLLGARWNTDGLRQTGWVLLPLRLFLGTTFLVASIEKFDDPAFFQASSPSSVQSQMAALAPHSPIGPLVSLSLHAGGLVGLLIALTELAVGLATLIGLRSRIAAAAGALLSLTFYLTVSWNTHPYYYGADIVFLFAWTPMLLAGSAGVLSFDAWRERPVTAATPSAEHRRVLERRALLGAALVGVVTAAVANLAGRSGSGRGSTATSGLGGDSGRQPPAGAPTGRSTPTSPQHGSDGARTTPKGMTAIARVDSVPVGGGKQFTDPRSDSPAWLVRTQASRVVAFSAVCTHAGCTVEFDQGAQEFVCPCHGGRYNALTGAVLAGPPPAPLPTIDTAVVDNEVYAA